MRNKILTHKVTRDDWHKGWYFKASQHSVITDAIDGYKITGEIYNSKNKGVFKCFLIVTDETLYTILGRL